ncbi:MAG: hypothetical protein P9M03_12185 [Candidatus Theseobacter exili]|nr:hypothetical protein [Candidatus Theseobacter exili]
MFLSWPKTVWFKQTAIIILSVFFTTSAVFPQGVDPSFSTGGSVKHIPTDKGNGSGFKSHLETLMQVSIPSDYGSVKSIYRGNRDKTLILIRDAHTHYEAQSNYARVLDLLVQNTPVSLIGIEGAQGELSTARFTSIPDITVRKRILEHLMKKGYLNGAEYYASFSKQPLHLYGVEKPALYLKNLEAFQKAQQVREEETQALSTVKKYFKQIQNNLLTEEMNTFLSVYDDYRSLRIKLTRYAPVLYQSAKKAGVQENVYPNFAIFLEALKIQKNINMQELEKEHQALTDQLSRMLVQEDLASFMKKSLEYKTKRLSPSAYFPLLEEIAFNAELDLSSYSNVSTFFRMLHLQKGIDKKKMKEEIQKLEASIKSVLLTTENARKIERFLTVFHILDCLYNLKVSREKLAFFQEHKSDFSSKTILDFITKQQNNLNLDSPVPEKAIALLDDNFEVIETFYHFALKRDKSIVETILAKMDNLKQDTAILVTGGFHTKGLMNQLTLRKISYMVISPRITDFKAETPYMKIMMGNDSLMEKFLVHHGRLAPPVLLCVREVLADQDISENIKRQVKWEIASLLVLYQYEDGLTDKKALLAKYKEAVASRRAELEKDNSGVAIETLEQILSIDENSFEVTPDALVLRITAQDKPMILLIQTKKQEGKNLSEQFPEASIDRVPDLSGKGTREILLFKRSRVFCPA